MKIIDFAMWPRKSIYDHFILNAAPHFSLTADVDVTILVEQFKPQGVAVFNAALFAVMRACNGIPELRQRLRGETVVEHDVVHPGITVPIDDERFGFAYFDYAPEWTVFDERCHEAVRQGRQQTELKNGAADRDDFIFTTCLPWVAFTAMTHPVQGPSDTFPRIAWGKFHQQGDRWVMPFNIQVHHALADGLHVGRFFEVVQTTMDSLLDME